MTFFACVGVVLHGILLGVLKLNNRGEVGTPPPPAAITAESLAAVQGDQFHALLPEEIRSKPYIKDVKGFGDLVKKLDGAQTLLGQRNAPDPTDPDEKWAEFHGKFRPEKADAYAVPTVEGIPSDYVNKLAGNPVLKGILHAAGASSYQAKILLSGIAKTLYTADQAINKQKDEAFVKLTTDLFGANKDNVLANGKKFLAANLPENVRPILDQFDEKQLSVVLAAVDGMAKKYTGEDPFRGGGGGPGGGGSETKDQLILQMQTIMKDPCYNDPFKDKPKHAQLTQQMEVIRGKLKKLQAG